MIGCRTSWFLVLASSFNGPRLRVEFTNVEIDDIEGGKWNKYFPKVKSMGFPGGGNSKIWMNFHPWGFMIQFDDHILSDGLVKNHQLLRWLFST